MPNPGQELSTINFDAMLGGPLRAVIGAQAQAAITTVNFIKSVGFEGPGKDANGNPTPGKPIYVSFRYPKEVAPYQPASTVITINVDTQGAGYTAAPTVALTGGSGRGATAVAVLTGDKVTAINVTNQGAGYAASDTITVALTDPPAGGTAAKASAKITANAAQPALYQEMQLDVPFLTIVPIPFIRIDDTTIDFHAKIHSVEYAQTDTNLGINGNLTVNQGWPGGSATLNVSASYQSKTTQGNSVERTYSMDVHIHAMQEELPAGMDRILGILEDAMKSLPVGNPQAAPLPQPSK
jgi:hypothetical protein